MLSTTSFLRSPTLQLSSWPPRRLLLLSYPWRFGQANHQPKLPAMALYVKLMVSMYDQRSTTTVDNISSCFTLTNKYHLSVPNPKLNKFNYDYRYQWYDTRDTSNSTAKFYSLHSHSHNDHNLSWTFSEILKLVPSLCSRHWTNCISFFMDYFTYEEPEVNLGFDHHDLSQFR